MTLPQEPEEGGLNTARIEAFSDGVIAIAITLLIILWQYIARYLLRPDADRNQVNIALKGGLIGLPFYILAIIFAYIYIPVSIAIYTLLPIFYIFINLKWSRS